MRSLIVLPTYNEAANIAEVLRRVKAAVPAAHVLVVDDSSPDGTAGIARAMADELTGIDVLSRPAKSGLGSAYRAGFRVGCDRGYESLVEMDSDLSHDPAALPSLLRAVDDGADLAIGSRYVPGGSIPTWGVVRRLISRAASLYTRALLMPVHDPTSGFKCYRRGALERIDLDAIHSRGYSFQIETTYRVRRAGGRIVEVPIAFVDRKVGGSKMTRAIVLEAVWKVPLMRLQALFGRI